MGEYIHEFSSSSTCRKRPFCIHLLLHRRKTKDMTDAKTVDTLQPREKPTSALPDRWTHQTFRDCLLGLSRGSEFRQPIEQMPKEIELSPELHAILDRMRMQTSDDMTERFMKIGFKPDRNALVLPNNGTVGLKGNVPAFSLLYEEFKMRHKGKTEGTIGDIHSHPRKLDDTRPLDILTSATRASFSLGDLYRLVYKDSPLQLTGIVDGRHNIFAIKTRSTQETHAASQDNFVEAWYRRNGWKMLKGENMNDGELAEKIDPNAPTIQELNSKIAAEYGFALYKGEMGKPLKRIYPEIPTPKHKLLSRINPFATKR